MHRVELKANLTYCNYIAIRVPNAPCGVESILRLFNYGLRLVFLMHRVELKDGNTR